MWIFTNNAMLSIVAPPEPQHADKLLVRARAKGDIERVFPDARVTRTPSRDYRYRALIGRQRCAVEIAKAIAGIEYGNFKGSVPEQDRHDAYLRVWTAMFSFQGLREGPRFRDDAGFEPALPLRHAGPKRKGRGKRGAAPVEPAAWWESGR